MYIYRILAKIYGVRWPLANTHKSASALYTPCDSIPTSKIADQGNSAWYSVLDSWYFIVVLSFQTLILQKILKKKVVYVLSYDRTW